MSLLFDLMPLFDELALALPAFVAAHATRFLDGHASLMLFVFLRFVFLLGHGILHAGQVEHLGLRVAFGPLHLKPHRTA